MSASPSSPLPPARSSAARTIVRATVDVAAPPEQVFDALTNPRELTEWWGSEDSYRTHDWQVDPRAGGAWSARTTDAEGAEGMIQGEFRVVDPPRLIECSWHASWDDGAPTILRYELTPVVVDDLPGTRVTVTHTRLSARAEMAATYTPAWNHVLEWLAVHLSECLV
ncbi:MAG TPA: SRPBCC domain-containing protein [Gemmatimonadaceae bacterium]|nr:SRPBCC domain-containing protein [Gemmatimonadaceae bacterium]